MSQQQPQSQHHCKWQDHQGHTCAEPAGESGLCYWHDPDITKNHPDDRRRLEDYAKRGGQLRGISLKRAHLPDLDLVCHGSTQGFDLTGADFYRANLRDGHFFNANFAEGSLMKANLCGANLHCAKVQDCNLLGIKLKGAQIDNIQIGNSLVQEKQAHRYQHEGERQKALDHYEQAEEVYRALRQAADRNGLFSMSGLFLRKELVMRRHQHRVFSLYRVGSKLVDMLCGYGEAPWRVILFSILLVFLSAILYAWFGIDYDDRLVAVQSHHSWQQNVSAFFECLYYSMVTFTTLGYGDYTPIGMSRLVAAIEAFTGSFTIALFVVVFVKKMTR